VNKNLLLVENLSERDEQKRTVGFLRLDGKVQSNAQVFQSFVQVFASNAQVF